ncbi:MAG: hypothetical protein ACREQM_04920, partial [Candidatus Dormibacteraceae bacterium]
HRIVGDVRGRGLMRGIELVQDGETKAPFPATAQASARLGEAALRRGLCVYPGGGHLPGPSGDQALIAPPLIVDEAELGELASRLDESLGDVERDLAGESFEQSPRRERDG